MSDKITRAEFDRLEKMAHVHPTVMSMGSAEWVRRADYEAMKDRAEKAEAGLARVKMDRDSLQKCVDSLTLLLRPWL